MGDGDGGIGDVDITKDDDEEARDAERLFFKVMLVILQAESPLLFAFWLLIALPLFIVCRRSFRSQRRRILWGTCLYGKYNIIAPPSETQASSKAGPQCVTFFCEILGSLLQPRSRKVSDSLWRILAWYKAHSLSGEWMCVRVSDGRDATVESMKETSS